MFHKNNPLDLLLYYVGLCFYFSMLYICSQVSDSLSLLLYSLHVRLLRALIKINQSINQSHLCQIMKILIKIIQYVRY